MEGREASGHGLTRALLLCGTAIGPVFYTVVVAQMLTRPGFEFLRHPLSLLALGDRGWIQTLNFEATAVLGVACAAGLARAPGAARIRVGAAILVAGFGLGLMIAGIFPSDAVLGFPPGSPPGIPATISGHAKMHGLGFALGFGSLIAASFVFARDFRLSGQTRLRRASIATGVVTPILIGTGMAVQPLTSVSFFVAGLGAFAWLGAVALDRVRSRR